MKLVQYKFLIAVLIFVSSSINLHAQSSSYVTINNTSVVTDSLFINDSVAAGNRMIYTAGFDMVLNTDDRVRTVLNELQSAIQKGVLPSIVLSLVNNINETATQRTYKNATVLEMQFCGLDASSKIPARIKVRLRSAIMSQHEESLKKLNFETKGAKPLLAANFKFEYGELPTSRIAKITSMQMSGQSQMIYLEISMADTDAWYKRIGTGTKKEKVKITLLNVNMKDEIMDIILEDTEIVSFSRNINNDNRIARFTIGLRTRNVSIANK